MDPNSDNSYHEDILKVKKIWDDIKQVDKQSKKTTKQKPSQQQKQPQTPKQTKNPKPQSSTKKTLSQANLLSQKHFDQEQIIQFSTQSKTHQPQLSVSKPGPSSYIQSHQFKLVIEDKDKELAMLRTTNTLYRDRIKKLQQEVEERDRQIQKLKQREHELLGMTTKANREKVEHTQSQVQYLNYKNDVRRLLKMLQTTQEYLHFATFALEDDGIRCLHEVNKEKKKTSIDARQLKVKSPSKDKNIHFCSCNTEFLPQHYLWVPEQAYTYAKQFAKEKRGEELSQAEIQLLLYELNRIWREREKRIVNTLNSSKTSEVSKYKRKLQDANRMVEQVARRNE